MHFYKLVKPITKKLTLLFIIIISVGCKSTYNPHYQGQQLNWIENTLPKYQANLVLDNLGKFMVTNKKGSTKVNIHSLKEANQTYTIEVSEEPEQVQLSSKGNKLAIVMHKKILVYELPTLQLKNTIVNKKSIGYLKFSHNEDILIYTTNNLLTNGNTISYDLVNDKAFFEIESSSTNNIIINKEDSHFVTWNTYSDSDGGGDKTYVYIYDIYSGQMIIQSISNYKTHIASDLKNVVTYTKSPPLKVFEEGDLPNSWGNTKNSKTLGKSLKTLNQVINHISFNKKANQFAIATKNKKVFIFDIATEALISEYPGHKEAVDFVAFDHNNERLLSASYKENKIMLWNFVDETEINSINTDLNKNKFVDFSPCSKYIYVFDKNKKQLKLYNYSTGDLENSFRLGEKENLHQLIRGEDDVFILSHENNEKFFLRSIYSSETISL